MNSEKIKLDAEERAILNSYEADEWRSVEHREAEMQRCEEYARSTFKKPTNQHPR